MKTRTSKEILAEATSIWDQFKAEEIDIPSSWPGFKH